MHFERPGYLFYRLAFFHQQPRMFDLAGRKGGFTAQGPAAPFRLRHARPGALGNQGPLELRQCPQHVEVQPAAWRGGVDGVRQGAEARAAFAQHGDDLDQVRQGAAQAVELPDGQNIVTPDPGKGLVQPWPLPRQAG